MAVAYIIYNEKAGSESSRKSVEALKSSISDRTVYTEISSICDYRLFLSSIEKEDYIILAGGDGGNLGLDGITVLILHNAVDLAAIPLGLHGEGISV